MDDFTSEMLQNYSVQMLPVREGDCFFAQFPYENGVFRMMIDCGTISCWDETLKPFFEHLIKEKIHINVLVLTHIDSDHIGGALCLFATERLSSVIDEVWFNGLRHLAIYNVSKPKSNKYKKVYSEMISAYHISSTPPQGPISVKQSTMLSALLDNLKIPWNKYSKGKPITTNTPSLTIAPGIHIDFLLPTDKGLHNLYQKFSRELNKIHMGTPIIVSPESEQAFDISLYCTQDTELVSQPIAGEKFNLNHITRWANAVSSPDLSVTNASSIAFCIRYFDRLLLFSGDATAEDLLPSLLAWREKTGRELNFDVIKLPHHGSLYNCLKLLEHIDGKYYLISTDGKKYLHPDKETLAKIVTRPTSSLRHLIFNYENDMYKLFSNPQAEQKYKYAAVVQTDIIGF